MTERGNASRIDDDHCRPIADIEGQHVKVGPTVQQTWSASASAKTRLDSSGSGLSREQVIAQNVIGQPDSSPATAHV
jgi:hypothetical protein